jgi:NAD(P)-dependent dehydrogenase (short-subunit alcohol dehydrogenase family)
MSARSVLVTAGASGIGLAIAEVFVARGDRVIVCDVDQAALDSAA